MYRIALTILYIFYMIFISYERTHLMRQMDNNNLLGSNEELEQALSVTLYNNVIQLHFKSRENYHC